MTPDLTTISTLCERSRPSWLQRCCRSNGFAWSVSLGLHVVLLAVFWQVALRQVEPVRRVIIPEARLAAAPDPAAPLEHRPPQLSRPPAAPADNAKPRVDAPVVSALTLDEPVALTDPGPRPTAGKVTLAGPVADAARPPAPIASFFGQSGTAYKVVYVVDVSASLMIYIDDILGQMHQSIRDLVPTQQFHVVLARPQRVEEMPARRLVPALARYKQEARDFLARVDRIPKPGKADPIEAMRRAFAVGPELIYFLSDGDYHDIEQELEHELQRLNTRRHVCITTIGFHPPRDQRGGPELLQRIAAWHNGHFRLAEVK